MSHGTDAYLPGEPQKNDALFLYGACQKKPFVYAYSQQDIEVVYGPACKPEREIYLQRCKDHKIPVRRRRGGGGTVVLSPGMVVTIVVGRRQGDEMATSIFSRIHSALIEVLGLNPEKVREKGISDLAIGERKILGSSLYLSRKPPYFYYQSSLMVCPDMSLISNLLTHPPKEPDYRQGRPHDSFCTCLNHEGIGVQTNRVTQMINRKLTSVLLEREELRKISRGG
ncbi:MAG: lipoyl protein ligase domain-containing protein [Fibrobacterota bacterium]